jgi:hypothetical protein
VDLSGLSDPGLVPGAVLRAFGLGEAPATGPLERDLERTTNAIARLVQAYQEDLLTLGELRARMPDQRSRQTSVQGSIDALAAPLVDQEAYLKLAEDLGSFLARLREDLTGPFVNTGLNRYFQPLLKLAERYRPEARLLL